MIADQQAMRDVWEMALAWYRRPAADVDRRMNQIELVALLAIELRPIVTTWELDGHYDAMFRGPLKVAQLAFPDEWPRLGVHTCAAVAYAIRHVEILTGRTLDPYNLPDWIGEWAAH